MNDTTKKPVRTFADLTPAEKSAVWIASQTSRNPRDIEDPLVQMNAKIHDSLDTRLDVFCAAKKIKKRDAIATALNEYLKRHDH